MTSFAARLVAGLVTLAARLCLRTSRISIASTDVLARTWDDGVPTVYVYWHDEFVLNVLLPLYWRAAAVRDTQPVCGANDTFGGLVIWSCLSRLGVPLTMLPRRSDRDEKRALLAAAVREHKHLLLAADYGTPWFKARPTAFQIARETGGRVVAMHLRSQRELAIARGRWRLRLPTPFNRYELHLAEVDVDPGLDDATVADALTEQLDALRTGRATRRLDAPGIQKQAS